MFVDKTESNGITTMSFVLLHLFCLKFLHLAWFPKGKKTHRTKLSEDVN